MLRERSMLRSLSGKRSYPALVAQHHGAFLCCCTSECLDPTQVYTGLYWSLPRDRLEGGTGGAPELEAAADAPGPGSVDDAAPAHGEGRAPLIGGAVIGTTRPPMASSAGV